jgi:Zn-dependent peptidase ImmA (M78 family)
MSLYHFKEILTMKNVIRLANDFILEHNIHSLPLKIDDLSGICNELGYELIAYQEAQELFKQSKMHDFEKFPAFTVRNGDCKIVLFDSTQSTGTRIFAIAHEIGHIVLQHNYCGVVGFSGADSSQEQEANTFAYQLIAPICVLQALNISTVGEIQRETLLDAKRAKQVQKAVKTYKVCEQDNIILRAYGVRRCANCRINMACVILACIVAIMAFVIIAQHFAMQDIEAQAYDTNIKVLRRRI